jgi:hypothetical protein
MAHFRAVILGQRGQASLLGSKKSGLIATIDGWHRGITVYANHINGKDVFHIYKTTGSAEDHNDDKELIAEVK